MLKTLIHFLLTFVFFSAVNAQFIFRPSHINVTANGQSLPHAWAGGLNSGQYGKIDLNHDGVEDLVVFDRSSNRLMTFIAQDNQWNYSPDYEYLFPESLENWMLLVDYNCDGKKDIFTHTQGGMKVFLNSSSGTEISFEEVANPLHSEGLSGRQVNLAVNQTDIPVIADLDGDGDLDILVFNFAQGDFIEYHQNLSMDDNGNCSELKFKRIREPWGDFRECYCNTFGFGERCETPDDFRLAEKNPAKDQSILHAAGKALLAIDIDGNGVKDLVLGMEDCEELYLLKNHGSKDQALIRSFSNIFPDSANPAKFHIFPAAYHEDVDFDGKKDLIVAPNFPLNPTGQIDFTQSSWFFKNIGSNEIPDFQYTTNKFLQSQMLDVGSNAAPCFADIDGDGDLDLIIGHRGFHDGQSYTSSLFLYENTGTQSEPSFELKDNNLFNLSSLNLFNIKPQFADINQDGLKDLIFSATISPQNQTRIYYLLNKGLFSFDINDLKELPFSIGMNDNFLVYDINKNGLPDLLHARVLGQVDYYRNTGSGSSPQFSLEKPAFLGLNNNHFRSNPSLAIADLNNNGNADLVITDFTGKIKIYPRFQDHLNTTAPEPITEVINNDLAGYHLQSRIGSKGIIALADLYNEGAASLITGTPQGGLLLYRNTSMTEGNNGFNLQLDVYPNPAGEVFKLKANTLVKVEIFTLMGQKVYEIPLLERGYEYEVQARNLKSGVYLVNAQGNNRSVTKKLIINK